MKTAKKRSPIDSSTAFSSTEWVKAQPGSQKKVLSVRKKLQFDKQLEAMGNWLVGREPLREVFYGAAGRLRQIQDSIDRLQLSINHVQRTIEQQRKEARQRRRK